MALLLAKKLGNQVTRLAEQAGLTLEIDLVNFYNDGERKAVGCKGTIKNLKTGKCINILSSESCYNLVCLEIIADPDDPYSYGTFNAQPAGAAEKIVSLLTPQPLTHDNLASVNITNLPDLDKNPLLSAYLSDNATSTDGWSVGRAMLRRTVRVQGFNPDDFTHYPSLYDGAKACIIPNALWSNLAQSYTEPHMVCHHLLAYHDVRSSETIKGRITYYQDDAKRKAGIRTPIKIRKYLQKFFKDFRSAEELERIAKTLDGLMQTSDDWDVRLYSDDSLDGWADAYYHITSCMSTKHKNYGVGEHETYRCYCTAAMTNGTKSSGLTLAVLYQDGTPVARAITFKDSNSDKFYVRNYGDCRLAKWLDDNGYTRQSRLPNGTHLWTEQYDNDDYLSPYVDGDPDDAKAEFVREDGQPYWVISSEGVVLQNCSGYTCTHRQTCDCCGELISVSGDARHRTDMDGNEVTLCHGCAVDYCHTVNDESNIYVSDDDSSDLIPTNANGCYYTQAYLDVNELVLTGDKYVIYIDHAEYCPYSDEYYHESEFIDLSDEPEFVRDTWAGYINDNDCVRDWLLRRDGTYIDGLDCRVHDAHVSAVRARLESEADAE